MPMTDCGNGRCVSGSDASECPPATEKKCNKSGYSAWIPVCVDGKRSHHCVSFPTNFNGSMADLHAPARFKDCGESTCVSGDESAVCPGEVSGNEASAGD